MAKIESHKRVNDILLGPLERPLLHWLAAHMPAWVNPDILTTIGVIGSVMVFSGYSLSYFHKNSLWLAILGFVVNWFGDSLDGTLARYRDIQRPQYGFFVDHAVDAVGQVLIFFGLGFSPYVRFDVASLALVGYLLVSILAYLNTLVSNEFKISYGRLGPTEMRLIAITVSMLVFFFGNPVIPLPLITLSAFDLIAMAIGLTLMTIFLVSMIRQATRLSKLENPGHKVIAGKV